MSGDVDISAVVISYNGIEFIADCINSLKDDLSGFKSEIIVVDNNSIDGTLYYLEQNHKDIRLIKNDRNLGFAKAINQGVAAAQHRFLWLLNQDIRIRKGALKTLLEYHANVKNPGVIGPRLIDFDGRLQRFCRRFPTYRLLLFELSGLSMVFPDSPIFNHWRMPEFDHCHSRAVNQPMGAAMLVARNTANRIGEFDTSFGIFFNDVDFCRRLNEAGYSNYYCAEAVIEHYTGGSISKHKAAMVWQSHLGLFRYLKKTEKNRTKSLLTRILRFPLPYLAGFFLVLAAVPCSIYHLLKSLFK